MKFYDSGYNKFIFYAFTVCLGMDDLQEIFIIQNL